MSPFRIYAPPVAERVRVRAVPGHAAEATEPANAERVQNALGAYFERLVKLIPGEVLGIYLTIRSFGGQQDGKLVPMINTTAGASDSFAEWWPVVCMGLVIISRVLGTRAENQSILNAFRMAQWSVVFVSFVSFVIWVYAIGDAILGFRITDGRFVGAAVAVWTFLVPMLFPIIVRLPSRDNP